MAVLDWTRKILLTAALILLTIPGFKGTFISFGPFVLGRFQPFKFIFLAWLIAQALWLVKAGVLRRSLFSSLRRERLIFGALALLDLMLLIGLLAEGGGERGFRIYSSLLLGQLAGLLSALDPRFPKHWMLGGLAGAAAILLGFATAERFFPDSPWVIEFLTLVRDDYLVSWQAGSTLTPSALAEIAVRSLPLTVLLIRSRTTSTWAIATTLSLGFLAVLSLEKGAILSLGAMLVVFLVSPHTNHFRRKVVILAATLTLSASAIAGPSNFIGRYLGWIRPASPNSTGGRSLHNMKVRIGHWRDSTHSILAEPWTGIGLDGYAFRNQNRIPPLEHASGAATHSHNLFLELGVSGGVLALGAFLVLLFGYAGFAWQSGPLWAPMLFLAGQFFSMSTDARIYVSWLAITLFWFAGMALKIETSPSNIEASLTTPDRKQGRPSGKALSSLC